MTDVTLEGFNLNPWSTIPTEPWASAVALHPNQPFKPVAEAVYRHIPVHAGLYVVSTRCRSGTADWAGVAELTIEAIQGPRRKKRVFLALAGQPETPFGFSLALEEGEVEIHYSVQVPDIRFCAGSCVHVEPPFLRLLVEEATRKDIYALGRRSPHGMLVSANQGGLANRLLPLLSVMDLAALAGRPAGVRWGSNQHCAASFEQLFDLDESGASIVSGDELADAADTFFDYGDVPEVLELSEPDERPIVIHSIRAVTSAPFGRPNAEAMSRRFQSLVPISSIREKLRTYSEIDLKHTVGMHIRRPFPNGAFSTLEQSKFNIDDKTYRDVISGIRTHNPDISNVFLATNAPELEEQLQEIFGEYLLIHKKPSIDNTQSAEAVKDALVDLTLLSRCQAVISATKSDFGYAAALLGRIPLYRLTLVAGAKLDVEIWKDGLAIHAFNHMPGVEQLLL